MRKGRKMPDLKVFRAMLLYIADYPDKVHHPKEDRYLFSLLRRRTDSIDATLSELEQQHSHGERLIRDIEHALNQYELQGDDALVPLLDLIQNYVDFYVDHMRQEEKVVLPAAVQFYSAEDWDTVNTAFMLNEQESAGQAHRRDFERLFSTIANITPAPIGLGPELQ